MAEKIPVINLAAFKAIQFPDGSLQSTALLSGLLGQLTQIQMPTIIDTGSTLTSMDLGVF